MNIDHILLMLFVIAFVWLVEYRKPLNDNKFKKNKK